jgi:hypothetical protein
LSNGYKFKFIYASGALGFDGNGWMWEKPLIKFGLIPTIYPSVWNLEDYKKAINSGADAISFGSILLRYPLRIKKIINVGGKNET